MRSLHQWWDDWDDDAFRLRYQAAMRRVSEEILREAKRMAPVEITTDLRQCRRTEALPFHSESHIERLAERAVDDWLSYRSWEPKTREEVDWLLFNGPRRPSDQEFEWWAALLHEQIRRVHAEMA